MGLTRKGPAHAAAKLLLCIATSLVAVPRCPAAQGKSSADDLPAVTDPIRCPDCDEDGKIPCPTCRGKGELSHVCDNCKGTGRRPCPVCRKDAQAAGTQAAGISLSPGRVTCDSCGGKGTLGNQGKPCPHCGGVGTLSCTTCGGKGTLACRKVIYDKVCPTCKFVGKITCTTCEGTTLVSPAVLAARRAASRKSGRAEKSTGIAEPVTRAPAGRAEEKPEASEPVVLPQEFPGRYTRLTRTYESHLDVFADDPKLKLDPRRREAAQLLKQLPAGEKGPGTVTGDLDAFVTKVDHLRKRWSELRGLFYSERASYLKTKGVWDSQESKLSDLPGHVRDDAEQELNRHLDIVLRISEKHAETLEREEPEWLQRELASIDAAWPELKKRGGAKADEAAKAEAAAKAEKAKREAAAALARAAKLEAESIQAGRKKQAAALALAPVMAPNEGGQAVRATQAEAMDEADSGPAPRKTRIVGVVRHSDSRSAASGMHPAAWALLGVCATALVFWLASRSRKGMPDQDSPPTAS